MTRHALLPAGLLLAVAATGSAQSLASRVASAPDGAVQFTFAARAGVCGNGRSFLSTGTGSYFGSWDDRARPEPCEAGPVRVVITRADRMTVGVETFVGPVQAAQGIADLGRVSPREASDFLLGLAASADGKPGRDAILPAALADSVDVTPALLALARDKARAREARRSALSWYGRLSADRGADATRRAADALAAIARDGEDSQPVRSQALSSLARIEDGAGVPLLITLTGNAGDAWLAREATGALARSGDPRARQHLRALARRADLPDDVLASAVRGIGREYATAQDLAFLRELYPRLTSDGARAAVIGAVADAGGAENTAWLLGLVRDASAPVQMRRRALSAAAERGGVSATQLVALYDQVSERELKEALISAYARSSDRAATDKVIQIARTDEDRNLRRRAISQLSRSDDPRVKQVLAELVER